MERDRGAHFHRADFQVHTPRDGRWKGKRPVSINDRASYARSFVAACRSFGLNAVAITDHHDLVFAPFIRRAAAEELDEQGQPYSSAQRLTVFPGVELTLALARQALLILDADFPDDRLPSVLHALAISPHDPSAASLPSVKPLDHVTSLADLHKKLDEHDWMKGRYIVLPNASDSGHKTIMRKGMQAEYKDMPCIGGYLDGSIDKIGTGNQRIFAGEDSAWGNKPLAIFQTSDARSEDFASLGSPSTWVKWAEPTAEALRQACLGHQSRISQAVPQLPTVFISRVTVSNSKFLGPVDVVFNSQYNAIIGGRGTGKSTILDYVRWGLCDQAAQAGDEELANPTVRRERLIENTLKPVGGQVEVFFTINDIRHVVRRDAATGEIQLKVGEEEFAKVREEHVRSLLPVHAYSQKQLSSVALRMDELTRFVTAPVQRSLDSIDQRIMESSGKLRENYAKVQRARDLDSSVARQQLTERSLAEQAANLRGALTDLSDEDRATLSVKPQFDSLRESLASQERELEDALAQANAVVERLGAVHDDVGVPAHVPVDITDAVATLAAARQQLIQNLRNDISAALNTAVYARNVGAPEHAGAMAISEAIGSFDRRYEEVKRRSSAHQAKLDELAGVEGRRTRAAELLATHKRDRQMLREPLNAHAELRSGLIALYIERSDLLSEETTRLTDLSGELIKASISRGQGLTLVEERFRGFIQGSGVRGGKIDQLFSGLRAEIDPLLTWEVVLSELESLLQLEADAVHTSQTTPNLTRLGFPLADQQRARSRMTADGWLDLALTPIRDEPLFEYQTKESEFIAFSAASAGQQATALLRVLLAQTGVPLIIDQPEEDLDSQVVQDVVTRIWFAKQKRQLIFASHNANLVVNGDSELVIAFDYRKQGDQSGGRVKVEGAIDVPDVRDEITRVMEGGEKAFRLRKAKYGF
ncbi:MAG: AAA family ATPase [Microlunatus sp.]|nr:AAA family ATPase [Microlunatus sp.]